MNSSSLDLPDSLQTASPSDGLALAWRLAGHLLANEPTRVTMPDHLRTSASRPAPEMVAAIYFHAIALANAGWKRGAVHTRG